MRVRARRTDEDNSSSNTTTRIECEGTWTVGQLREAVERALFGKETALGERGWTFVSLNGKEDVAEGAEGGDEARLVECGVSSGDLLRCAWRRNTGNDEDATKTKTKTITEKSSVNMRKGSIDDGIADDTMEVDARACLDGDVEDALPRTMRETLREWSGALTAGELAFLAIHALMLDMGAKTIGNIELRDGLARRGCYSAKYRVCIAGTDEEATCTVRAQPVEDQLSVFGALEADAALAFAALVRVSDYVALSDATSITLEGCRALWDKVREGMASKLFSAVNAQLAGILSAGSLMSLPAEVKWMVAERMDAYGLSNCACTCRELRKVCSDQRLWTALLRQDFGIDTADQVNAQKLYNTHAVRRSMEREAQLRAESYHPMPGRLPRHGLHPNPDRDIYPGLPGHVPGIVGGDYDLWPGGLNPNPRPRPVPGFGGGGLGAPTPRGGWPGGGPPFPPQPGGLPYNPDPDADLRYPPDMPNRGRGGRLPSMPPNPGYDGRPRPPPDFF